MIEVQVLVLAMQRLGSVFASASLPPLVSRLFTGELTLTNLLLLTRLVGSSHALSVEGLKSLSLDDDLSTVERGQPF